MRGRGPDLRVLHAQPVRKSGVGDGDGDAQDADDDAERAVVWASAERDAVGRGGVGVWRGGSRGGDSAQGEGGEEEGGGKGGEEGVVEPSVLLGCLCREWGGSAWYSGFRRARFMS